MRKKMTKRLLAVILTAALTMGMLQGCGRKLIEDQAVYPAETAKSTEEAYTEGYAEAEAYADIEMPAEEAENVKAEAAAEETNREAMTERDNVKGSYAESCYDYEWKENTEEYSKWEERGFRSVLKEPLSTFAADVDTASYSNLRRLLTEGYSLEELPRGAVRIEELLNYFSYDYEEPKGQEPFGVTTKLGACPWNEEAQLLMIGLKTEDIDYSQAPPSNLVFLLDVSGSMSHADKLPLLQESFGLLAENLTEKDRISIVTYAGDDEVVLRGAAGNETRKIKRAINRLKAGGGTNGSKGIETAYEIAEENFIKGGNNRIILATDGDLNIGLTTEEELEELITEKKESGIYLSVLGFGAGNLKDNKMEVLADKGNGNYAYIDSLREARKVLVEEMTATLLTICKDVKLQVEFNPSVVSDYRLIGYENRALNREDFEDDTKDAGEIGAGHSVTVLYELILKEPITDLSEEEIKGLKYEKNYKKELKEAGESSAALYEEWLTLSIRYKKPAEDSSNRLRYPVSYEDYQSSPDDDFVFAAAVAEFGLLASDSAYAGDASLKHVRSALKGIILDDEYKEEFYDLVKMAE
ncbi:MAG: VWA domain-containing protein [Bacillota bacterium]|nr:VWA domain-containing protein [Bacillota bacterium]